MRTFRNRAKQWGIGTALVGVLGLGLSLSGPALADNVTGTASISGGSLTMAATDAPALSATLNGANQNVTDTVTIDVKDYTGTGDGWKLQITSTTFSTGGASPKTLATSATTITAASATCDGGTCTAPTNGITYPVTVPAATTAPAAVSFFNAAAASGLGDFTITPTFSLAVPASTFAGNYSSTMTITVASAP